MSLLQELLHKVWSHFWSFDAVVVLLTWITALAGAAFTYLWQTETPEKNLRGFKKFCLPAIIFQHPSCRLDAVFVVVMHFVRMPAGIMLSNLVVAEVCYATLAALFGAHPHNPEPLWLYALIMAVAVVLQDFMTFFAHVLQHKWRLFWELHKVHHSTEFLVPISNRRFHPLQAIMDNWFAMFPVGVLLGATSYAFSLPIHDNSLIGLDALFIMNLLSFYHLRHSHVPMRYGWLERHLISPAQHQLHHSREERHWDRNFGFCFSWWDRIWGTIIYSTPGEQFALGLPAEDQRQLTSVPRLFVVPVTNIARLAWRTARRWLPPGSGEAAPVPPMRDAA